MLFEGKVRKIFAAGDDALLIVTTDRISAYDVIMPTPIDGKGKILNQLSSGILYLIIIKKAWNNQQGHQQENEYKICIKTSIFLIQSQYLT